MVRSIHPSAQFADHRSGRVTRTAKRVGLAAMFGLALLAAPLGPTSHASTIRTSPHLPMTCDGPRNFKGPWNVPFGTYQATVNFCDSGEYYQTLLQWTGTYSWEVAEYDRYPISIQYNTGSGPTTTYSPGSIYDQSQMYSEVILGQAQYTQGPF